jgi:glycosyltransferase involved in cell wall biosynthesis
MKQRAQSGESEPIIKPPEAVNGSAPIDVLYAVTSPLSLNLLRGQLRYLRTAGFHPAGLCSPGAQVEPARAEEGVPIFTIPIQREIAVARDLFSLVRIWRLVRRLRPRICNAGTPKAGLLVGLAAWLNGVPCRLYTMRGLRLETATGLKRRLLKWTETLACACAHQVICVSPSLRQRAIALGVVVPEKTIVLGAGSSNGVNVARFSASPERLIHAAQLRRELGIEAGRPVVGFVGRLTRDKGLPELLRAFHAVSESIPDALLLLVGGYEAADPLPPDTRAAIDSGRSVIQVDFTADPAPYYLLMDVFVLPTHREGFPNTVLEAQAAGRPVVTTRATGAVDSVCDGVTGLLVPVGDDAELARAMLKLLQDPELAERMGEKGRERTLQEFHQEIVWEGLAELYRK